MRRKDAESFFSWRRLCEGGLPIFGSEVEGMYGNVVYLAVVTVDGKAMHVFVTIRITCTSTIMLWEAVLPSSSTYLHIIVCHSALPLVVLLSKKPRLRIIG